MNNDSQRTRSDKKKLPAPQGTQLFSVPEREEPPRTSATRLLQRSPVILPNFSNTSPNNPFFQLGVNLHRPKSPLEEDIDDIEDALPPSKQTIQVKKGTTRISPSFTSITPELAPQNATNRTSPEKLSSLRSLSPKPSAHGTPAPSQASLQAQFEAAANHIAAITKQTPTQLRDRELELAAFAGPKERRQLLSSRALNSQDSDRSQDGPITNFLPKTTDGYLKSKFIKGNSETPSQSLSQSQVSGGSASQSTYYPSQNSEPQNLANPQRQYNFRQRAPQTERSIRQQFIRQDDRQQCQRCGAIHFYIDDFCTATVDIDGEEISALPHDTFEHRVQARMLFSLNEPDFALPLAPTVISAYGPQLSHEDVALFAEFLKFKAAQDALNRPPVIPSSRPLTDDEETSSQTSLRSHPAHDVTQMASIIASAISQTMAQTPTAVDIASAMATAIGKTSHNMTTNDPPKITRILDSIHLMTVIWPAYQVYEHQAGAGKFRSLWDLYSRDQKTDVLEFFQAPIIIIEDETVTTLIRDEKWFDSLPTPEFLVAMCKELGYPSVIATEAALKEIKFPGPLSDLQSWVTFKASWILALKQMSSRSRISDKNLSTIFKNSLPSIYWKANYDQQGHRDWLSGYKWCVLQLSNKEFQSGYNIDAEQLLKSAGAKHSTEIEELKKKIALLESAHSSKKNDKSSEIKQEGKQKPAADHADKAKSDKVSDNKWEVQGNVNPKWDPNNQRDDNPEKKSCSICNAIHKYADELCTAAKVKGTTTDTPRLDPTVLHQRKWDKQQLGHYCTKLVSNPTLSSEKTSIEAHHGKAAATAATLGGAAKKK
jgi:hypothetical protein